jgi:hypothetical protein
VREDTVSRFEEPLCDGEQTGTQLTEQEGKGDRGHPGGSIKVGMQGEERGATQTPFTRPDSVFCASVI